MITVIRSYQRFHTYFKESKMEYKKIKDINQPTIFINSNKEHQTHLGFGGAFTESAALTFAKANTKQQQEIIEAYYGEYGHKYNLGRTVIHSCDFSEKTRFYIEEGATDLSTFDMSEDDKFIVPMIKKAQQQNTNIWFMSSIWTPLPHMKSNQDPYYGGKLLPEYDDLFADYFIEYFKGMKERGIDINATSLQNEPEAIQVWESCHYTANDELRLAKKLSEKLDDEKLDVKLIIWDHNRDNVFERSHEILREIPDQVWGVGYHWYVTEDSENLSMVHDFYPNHHILFTEGCVEYTNTALNSGGTKDDLWKNAEWYARNIINDANNYSEGFIDWNLLLNEEGGPNHVGNYCEAPIMFDRNTKEIIYNPSYYYIGHFSRYVEPGAKKIHINMTNQDDVFATAYKNPNGDVVLIVLNQNWVSTQNVYVDNQTVELSLPAKSITTVIFQAKDIK